MDPQTLVFALVFAGIILIFAELFLPSGGIIGVLCVGCFLASGYFAYEAWYKSAPFYWWTYLGSVALIIPTCVIGGFMLLTRTSLGNRILLRAPTEEEVTPYIREQQHLEALIGKRGTAANLMTPGGMVIVNGERIHAISEGVVIEANAPIEIIAARGTRVVVRPISPHSMTDEFNRLAEVEEPKVPSDGWDFNGSAR